MHPRAILLAVALLAPSLAWSPAGAAPAPAAFNCEQRTLEGLPCNLRMTFGQHIGTETFIAMNPDDPDNFVAAAKDNGLTGTPGVPNCSAQNVWTGWYATQDGGQTWTNGYAAGYPTGPVSPITGYRCSTDPVVAFDGDGSVLLSGLAYNNTGSTDTLWVARSTDGGQTFGPPRAADTRNFDDKNWLAVDPVTHDVYVTWTCFNSCSGIWFKRNLGGDLLNWQGARRISSSGGVQGSFPIVGPDGTLYVSYNTNIQGGNGNMLMVRSFDHGATFDAQRTLFSFNAADWSGGTEYRTPTIPQLAVDRSDAATRGNLYLVWQDKRNGDPDIYTARSTDGGTTWGTHIRLNDDPVSNGKGQNLPAIAVDPVTGWVHATWYDRRYDAGNRLFTTMYALSKDGGLTWSANQRVGANLNDPTPCRHQDGSVFIGDYMGVVAVNGKARPTFVDTRNNRCDLYTALLFAGPRLQGAARPHANLSVPETFTLTANAYTDLTSARMEVDLPDHWSIVDAGGATIIPGSGITTLRWDLGAVVDRRTVRYTVLPTVATVVDVQARLDWALDAGLPVSGHERWNATVRVSYPVVELNLTAPASAPNFLAYNVSVLIQNLGFGALEPSTVEILVPNGTTPVPRGAGANASALVVGPTFGNPASDPTLPPLGRIVWNLPSVAKQSQQVFRLELLAPPYPTAPSGTLLPVTGTLTGKAPDGAILRATMTKASATRFPGIPDVMGQPAELAGYFVGG